MRPFSFAKRLFAFDVFQKEQRGATPTDMKKERKKEKQQENNFWSLGLLGIPVLSLLQRELCFTAGFLLWSGEVGDADKLCFRCVLIRCKMFHQRHFVPFVRRRRCANPLDFFLSPLEMLLQLTLEGGGF